MFKNNENFDVCILWDKGLTHYFVGLTCNEYSITLDVDDFNDIFDNIVFLKNAIEILKEKGIDSQGIYEYIKEIVDITLGPEARKKVWKEIKGNNNEETRYIRCLILDVDGQKYIINAHIRKKQKTEGFLIEFNIIIGE